MNDNMKTVQEKKGLIIKQDSKGNTEINVPFPIDMAQEVTLIVNRGNGDEINIEKD